MNKPIKEPIKNVKIWMVLGLIFLLSVPWYFPQGSYQPLIFGIPYWALFIIAVSIALSAFLTYVLKYEWHMEEEASHVKEDE
ncbi:MAG: hypothetical protein LOD88_13655 [Novibacillus thermophilus]|jgi:hypothetical protein|uniref:DUF3311 domain-containing protein n=1 Tax=Novibacillus thermophilus TaxID=1471761 RepID=A0A1U9K7K2_9BACL|nr:hypothetical protein [Novibacillus thermophilus]AQS55976.1 hypothetical protein B0W44_09540 [Novibacillus thermophilus]